MKWFVIPKTKWLQSFLRVNDRKKRFYAEDLLKAGYPYVDLPQSDKWQEIHKLCEEMFRDGKGRPTYVWFGHKFFFTTKEDADLFKGLLYMI